MKILIIGGSGLLGNYLIQNLGSLKNYQIHATFYKNKIGINKKLSTSVLNILSERDVNNIINKEKWDLVLHTASKGDVDFCEKNKKIAWDINVRGTSIIVSACMKYNRRLIYFSTNAVFDGEKGNYKEEDKPNPINYYGFTKLKAENAVNKYTLSNILRLNTMYGWAPSGQRDNPASWIIKQLSIGKNIKIVDDIFNNHLWAGYVGKVIMKIAEKKPKNRLYHIGGGENASRYEFALKIAEIFKFNKNLIIRTKSSNFQSLAPRPKNTTFNVSRMIKDLKLTPLSIKEGLFIMKQETKNN